MRVLILPGIIGDSLSTIQSSSSPGSKTGAVDDAVEQHGE
jgi:hypothetical protein